MKQPFLAGVMQDGCAGRCRRLDEAGELYDGTARLVIRGTLARVLLDLEALRRRLVRSPAGAVRLLIIHDVPSAWEPGLRRLLEHLGKEFGFVTPAEAEQRLCQRPDDGRCPVLVTFDDGFVSNARIASDLLDPMGIKALFFVCPGLIDLPVDRRRSAIAAQVFRGTLTAGQLPAGMDVMDWTQLAGLQVAGHAIGCHGMDHLRLAGLDDAALDGQVMAAKRRMAEILGGECTWFAFPFGDVDSIDSRALTVVGRHFRWCRSGIRGLAHASRNPLALPAESVDLGGDWTWQRACAEGALAPLYRARLGRLQKMAEKAA